MTACNEDISNFKFSKIYDTSSLCSHDDSIDWHFDTLQSFVKRIQSLLLSALGKNSVALHQLSKKTVVNSNFDSMLSDCKKSQAMISR